MSRNRVCSLAGSATLALAVCSLVLDGCRSGADLKPAAPAVAEASVKPGVNTEYLKPDLDVSQWVERFEHEGREIYDHREAIVAAVGLKPGMVVADIGAGTGLFTPYFSRAVGAKGRVMAVDIVPAFLERIRQRATAEGLANVQTVLGTERSVELPPNSIDVAFICDVYHHFEYPHSSMTSLHRALRPGGVLAAGLFVGALRTGALSMQALANTGFDLATVIQALMVLVVAVPMVVGRAAR